MRFCLIVRMANASLDFMFNTYTNVTTIIKNSNTHVLTTPFAPYDIKIKTSYFASYPRTILMNLVTHTHTYTQSYIQIYYNSSFCIMLHYNVIFWTYQLLAAICYLLSMLRMLASKTCPIPFGTKCKTVIFPSEHHVA